VRFLAIIVKSWILFVLASLMPAALAFVFLGWIGSAAAAALVAALIYGSACRAERNIERVLRPKLLQIGSYSVRSIEDPSSHAFATQALFSKEPTLWITRGALSLLRSEELPQLLAGMSRASARGGLRFETILTAWIIRVTGRLPAGIRDLLFLRQRRAKPIFVRESIRGAIWLSIALVLDRFYFSSREGEPGVPEEVLRKLQAESRRCVPRLPPALSSHSAVSPWPDAIVTLGRPCLLPIRAVDLRA
jgi:hypothetical protein